MTCDESASSPCRLGDRVLVVSRDPATAGERLDAATVRYLGPVGGEGVWAGVEFDAAGRGKHDGTHGGVSYFQAPPLSSSFVRLHKLRCGGTLLQALAAKYEQARRTAAASCARAPHAAPRAIRRRSPTRPAVASHTMCTWRAAAASLWRCA